MVSESYDRVWCECMLVSVVVWNNNDDDDMKKLRNVYVATRDTRESLFYLFIVLTLFQHGDGVFFFNVVLLQ